MAQRVIVDVVVSREDWPAVHGWRVSSRGRLGHWHRQALRPTDHGTIPVSPHVHAKVKESFGAARLHRRVYEFPVRPGEDVGEWLGWTEKVLPRADVAWSLVAGAGGGAEEAGPVGRPLDRGPSPQVADLVQRLAVRAVAKA